MKSGSDRVHIAPARAPLRTDDAESKRAHSSPASDDRYTTEPDVAPRTPQPTPGTSTITVTEDSIPSRSALGTTARAELLPATSAGPGASPFDNFSSAGFAERAGKRAADRALGGYGLPSDGSVDAWPWAFNCLGVSRRMVGAAARDDCEGC
jgi:hypothetical protein